MDALLALAVIVIGLLVLAIGGLLLQLLFGSDPDLQAPWDPSLPFALRRGPEGSCAEWTCRIDHRAVNPWTERAPR